MQEAERVAGVVFERLPVIAHRLQQAQGADHVGLDEGRGAIDRTVDVALGGEVHHGIGPVLGQQPRDQVAVADVAVDEDMVGIAVQPTERVQIAGVGQGIQVDDANAAGNRIEDEVTADETGSAGDKPRRHLISLFLGG